jgi:hypothetical protein
MTDHALPAGVRWATLFFALSGALDFGLTLAELPRPLPFGSVWQAVGSGLLYLLLAAGLRLGFAICRSLAMVYCLATLATYGVVLAMALGQAPLAFPRSVFVGSLLQVPSCAVLLPYLRSPEAAHFFRRPLL